MLKVHAERPIYLHAKSMFHFCHILTKILLFWQIYSKTPLLRIRFHKNSLSPSRFVSYIQTDIDEQRNFITHFVESGMHLYSCLKMTFWKSSHVNS
jgi:hypothetical protein